MRNNSLIVIPTYNELNNVSKLIGEIDKFNKGRFDLVFVDDNSPDGTGRLLEEIKKERGDIFVIHRENKMGIGSAYLAGFRYGVDKGYDYIFEMDADLSHSPEYLNQMVEELKSADVVVGSRFMGEWRNINKTPVRIWMSILAAWYMRLLLGIKCSDPMGGFIGYRKRALESIIDSDFLAKGYAFQAEVKYRAMREGFKMSEIPIIFKNRNWGDSKIARVDMAEALLMPLKIKFKG